MPRQTVKTVKVTKGQENKTLVALLDKSLKATPNRDILLKTMTLVTPTTRRPVRMVMTRRKRALLHLSYSYAPPFGPALLVSHGHYGHCASRRRLMAKLKTARAAVFL
jgi:hypothetical protein